MENNVDSMLDIYLFEANSLLDQLDEILLDCEKQSSFSQESINEIFRIMHTIKGSSAMMQFTSLMTIAHKVEDLFYYVRENGIQEANQDELFDLMFKSNDFLKGEIENLENNRPLTIDIGNLQQEISNLLKKISTGETDTIDTVSSNNSNIAPTNLTNDFEVSVRVFFEEGCQMENLRAMMLLNSISDVCSDVKHIPEVLENNPNAAEQIIQNGFIIGFSSKEDYEKCVKIIESFIYTKDYTLIEETKKVEDNVKNENTPSAEASNLQPQQSQSSQQTTSHAKQSLINVNLSRLDNLMNIVGEIVIAESMITAIPKANGFDLEAFEKATRQLIKLTDELQETVTSIRMVPVSGVFQKMHRIVRDMCKKLGKDVDLKLIGEDTEVDKTIVDSIGDPLMHIVRNSMDHGIETTEVRNEKGKDPKGTIVLSAENTGGEILICVTDDGKGMDAEAILKKAKKNGLLTKPESEYTEKEALALLLMPGFSTKEEVTEFSGRGVGMDVVKKNIESVGGEVSIESELGKGSKVIIKIPLTLAIVKGMALTVGSSLLTLPINCIKHSFKATEKNIIHDASMNEIAVIGDKYYPIIRLHDLYDIETTTSNLTDGILILVETSNKDFCVFADKLLGEQQVVVKSLPEYFSKYTLKDYGISGCAVLGDGSISMILDGLSLSKKI